MVVLKSAYKFINNLLFVERLISWFTYNNGIHGNWYPLKNYESTVVQVIKIQFIV